MRRLLGAAAAASLLAGAGAAPAGHQISSIPGYGKPKSSQFAGLLNVSTKEGEMHYHYWLATSQQSSAATDPVAFWFQGGPGANSVAYGLLTENGPYYMDDTSDFSKDKYVYDNDHSWNKVANYVWVEHPPGVGFSYCGDNPKVKCSWDDDTQAEAAYGFIKEFFKQYPEYGSNDVFVTGESYGGMYVPTIVEQIHNNGGVNLKGFAIGNGVIGHQDSYPGEAGATAKFLHAKAFISEELWGQMMDACGWDFSTSSSKCDQLQSKARRDAGDYYIYNVYDTCGDNQVKVDGKKPWLRSSEEWDAHIAATGRIGAPDDYPCGMEKQAVKWLNLPEVRAALHVPPESFYGCKVGLYPCGDWSYGRGRAHLLNVYPNISGAYRTLIYNGDFDGCVPYIGMEGWTSHVFEKFGVKEAWRPWKNDDQVAGYVTVYDHNNFTAATVKGSGHMVPQYKGRAALTMISKFFAGRSL